MFFNSTKSTLFLSQAKDLNKKTLILTVVMWGANAILSAKVIENPVLRTKLILLKPTDLKLYKKK